VKVYLVVQIGRKWKHEIPLRQGPHFTIHLKETIDV
jgi:hypothetical protein